MTFTHHARRLLRAAAATFTASALLASGAALAQAEDTPALGTSITLTAGAGGALNGPDFRIAKLAGFTLDNGAAIVETETAAQADVVASLPTSADTADVAKDYDAAADGDPIAWLARQGDAKDSSAWRLFAQRMAETDTVTQAAVTTGTATQDTDGAIAQVLFERLEPGLYLLADANTAIEGTTRSTPILVGTAVTGVTPPIGNADGIVEIKNQRLTIDKTIVDGEATHPTADKSVGDAVAYRIEAGIPDTGRYENNPASPYVFRMLDTLSKGQRFNNDLTVEATADGVTWTPLGADDYTLTTSGPMDGTAATQIAVDLSSWVYENGRTGMAGGVVRVSYTATLTVDAVVDGAGNTNGVTLTYSNDPATNHTGEITPPDTRVYTHGFRFLKTGADGTTPLEGAVFTLYKGAGFADADKYRRADKPGEDVTATSSADGVVRFDGLAAGEYWVKETGVPAGYRDLDVKFKVVITASNGADAIVRFEKVASVGDALVKPSDDGATLVVSNVQNLTQLPLTGSGGIALFVVVGGLLAAAGAVAAVITRRKAGALKR